MQRPASQRRDGLNLDQERLLHEPVHDQECVGWIGAVRKEARKLAQAVFHESRDVLRVHEISGELHDVGEARALRLERGFDVGEDLPALRFEVLGANHLAVLVCRKLARDEQKLGRPDTGDLRILTQRLAERRGILDGDVGHDRSSNTLRHARGGVPVNTASGVDGRG